MRILQFFTRWLWRSLVLFFLSVLSAVILGAILRPFPGAYQVSQAHILGGVQQNWVPFKDISKDMARAVIAAEDANFCTHYGVDFNALRQVWNSGARRGASTITMQVAKNVYLWNTRSYLRKGLEIPIALLIDILWSKPRILEVYLNIAEFDRGIFGIKAGATHYFGHGLDQFGLTQAARLAALLPNPQQRSASKPSTKTRKRSKKIMDGVATIQKDGRDYCIIPDL